MFLFHVTNEEVDFFAEVLENDVRSAKNKVLAYCENHKDNEAVQRLFTYATEHGVGVHTMLSTELIIDQNGVLLV